MVNVTRGIVWVAVLMGVCVSPLVVALVGASRPGQGFWTDFSVALGFAGLALMGIEFVLVARVRRVAEPFGTDAVIDFHRYIGITGMVFILAHVALSADWSQANPFVESTTPPLVLVGGIAVAALLLLVATSVWRRRLRLSYETWQVLHAGLAIIAVVAGIAHIFLVNYYIDTPLKRALWMGMSAAFIGVLVWVRVVRPLRLRRQPWLVDEVATEADRTTVITMRPDGHAGMRFAPGQFAWISVGRSPFLITSHPFSFSSSAERNERVSMAIKAVGDFTSSVAEVTPGTVVNLDGPHGVFSIDHNEGAGYGLFAGGVGIAPALSMVETLADRADRRPVVLFVCTHEEHRIIMRSRIEALREGLDIRVVYVLVNPPPGWTGESGYLDAAMIARYLPDGFRRFQYFGCGPVPMLDVVEDSLVNLGVPADRVHTERFDWV